MKKTSVRSTDHRRMLQATTHSFPANAWRNKVTNVKESDKYDLCKDLWIKCDTLSKAHTAAHHHCWRLLLNPRRTGPAGLPQFMCLNREKSLKTILDELSVEFPDLKPSICACRNLCGSQRETKRWSAPSPRQN
jgi:hypothetical protein